MATLTIKNIPTDLHAQLKQSAFQHHRSINGEVIMCLERVLKGRLIDPVSALAKARALRKKAAHYYLTEKSLNKAKKAGRL